MSVFNTAYQSAMNAMAGAHGTAVSAEYINNVNSAVEDAIKLINNEANRVRNVGVHYAKGNLAEAYHAGTFNASAAAKSRSDVAAEMIINNKPGQDVRYGQLGIDERMAELKYYRTGENTAKALNNPLYSSVDAKVTPSDQLEEVINVATKESLRNREIRPEVSQTYAHTAEAATDNIEYDGVSSKPLSHKDAVKLAKESKSDGDIDYEDYGLAIDEFVEWSDIAREAGQAALHAAAFSAALTAAPFLAKAIVNGIKSGEVDVETLKQGSVAVATTTPQVTLRAFIAAAITGASQAGYCGEAMKKLSPHAIGIATTMVINSIGHSIRYAKGDIGQNELALNCIRDSIALTSGLLGASLGSTLIPIPLMGALIGNMVGATVGALVFHGAHSITLGICVETGWTMFGLVDQNYQVPEDVLEQCGFDLIKIDRINIQHIEPLRFQTQNIKIQTTDMAFLRRGVIGMSSIGYI